MNWPSDVDPAPALLVLPPAAADLGEAEAAIELWEHYSRKTLDDTQRLAVFVMMAQADGGKWAAATTGREMPRQNGKGDEIEVVELWGLVQRAEAILHTVHDAVLLATQSQQRMLGVLEGHADLRRKVKRKWQGTGQQMIEMRNGGAIWYRTRTGGGGRGVDDIDRLVVDEAQHATGDQLSAVSPTLLANANPQLNALGTAGLAGVSSWWWRMRLRALSGDPGSFGYIGHTAERVHLNSDGAVVQEDVDVEDRDLWRAVNPAIAAGRGSGMAFLEEQFLILGPQAFAREHLGVWDPPDLDDQHEVIVDPKVWADLEDVEDARPDPVAYGLSTSPDRKWTTIGLAGRRSDGGVHVQPVKSGRGTAWVADEVGRLVERWGPLSIAVGGSDPASSLVSDLEKVKRVKVRTLSTRDEARGCGMFVDAVAEESLHHGGGPQMARCLGAARKREMTGGGWVWAAPADGSTDIAPLKAVTAALFALTDTKSKARSGVVYL